MTTSLRQGVAAIILAAGRGERAGTHGAGPKQYRFAGGRTVLARTVDTFLSHASVGRVVLVIHRDDRTLCEAALGDLFGQVAVVEGGATRQASTLEGLRALAGSAPDSVLIHDAARPFVDEATIDRVIESIRPDRGAVAALPVSDTLKRAGASGQIEATVDRAALWSAQTPQGFPYAAILAAHQQAAATGRHDFTDDAAIAEAAGLAVALVEGSPDNFKITWPHDLARADLMLSSRIAFPDVRTGNGYDVHAFEPGNRVMLCGVEIPHSQRLCGHSDADVGLHALTDALLATCGAGDIGTHFPPSDPRWKGAASRIFVAHAAAIVRERGGRIANADVTLICEAPKVAPHRTAMVAAMADMLGIAAERVSVKATTNERLGFVGRGEGIAAIATATVVYPGALPE